MQDVDEEFFNRADAHIHLSNDQITDAIGRGKVSASMMYATARFNSGLQPADRAVLTNYRKQKMKLLVIS